MADHDGTDRTTTYLRRRLTVGAGVVVVLVGGAVAALALGDRGGDEEVATPVAATADDTQASSDAGDTADVADEEARAAEEAAEAERRAQEEREAEEQAERERIEAEEQAERERIEAEEQAERERIEAAERAAEEARRFVEAQERLRELGYLVGAADGEKGQQTTAAIMAFQAVNGLGVDGALGPQTYAALDAPREPSLRGGPGTRIEVDMDRQVLHLVEGGARVTTMKVSTGRGGTFESQDGQTLRAETPVGTFTIDRRIAGEKPSSYGIGSMWDPMYFHGPWAIHGSPNVPAGPASSGCVRVSMADGRWLFDRVPNGTPVVLYGGTHVFTP